MRKTLNILLAALLIFPSILMLNPPNQAVAASAPQKMQSIKYPILSLDTKARYEPVVYWTQLDDGRFHAGFTDDDGTVISQYADKDTYAGMHMPAKNSKTNLSYTVSLAHLIPPTWSYNGQDIDKSLLSDIELASAEYITDSTYAGIGTPVISGTSVRVTTQTGGYPWSDNVEYAGNGKWQTSYRTPLSYRFKANAIETKEIDVNPDSTITIGQTKTLNASVRTKTPDQASISGSTWVSIRTDAETAWTSSNPSIVSVTGGVVKGLKAGTSTVTATWTKGDYVLADTATITVSDNPGPDPSPEPTPSPDKNFTGDFDVTPSTISYRDSFSIKPRNFSMNGCTYVSHQYKIARGGMTWTSSAISGQSTTSSYSFGSYPFVIGVGSHDIFMKIKTSNCGESDWIGPKTLNVNGPSSNSPPIGKIGFVDPNKPTEPLSTAIEGSVLNLVLIYDPTIPIPSDPDGDAVYWDGFNFEDSDAWTKDIPNKSGEYMDGYHNIVMNGLGYHHVKAQIRDEWGATTTLTTVINVVPPNPVPVITGSTTVVEGRPLDVPLNADKSYSPVGRSIDHSKDIWTNKQSVYTNVGTETITLEVFDSIGLKSVAPATHQITVKPDLPPIPKLSFVPITVRGNEIQFTNTSYSPDNDKIVSNVVSYIYDANNDDVFNEASVPVIMDAQNKFSFKPTKIGSYRFSVTVVEDWGKRATATFDLEVVNDSPTATYTLKGTVNEPTVTPYTYLTASNLASSTWGNSSTTTSNLPKRWVIDPTENSIVATTDKNNRLMAPNEIITNTTLVGAYGRSPSYGQNYRDGNYQAYLGDGYIIGRNTYYGRTEIYNVDIDPYNYVFSTNIQFQYFDLANDMAYGTDTNMSQWPYKSNVVSVKISDLKNSSIASLKVLGEVNNYGIAGFLTARSLLNSTNNSNLIDSGVDVKTITGYTSNGWGGTVNSYQYGSFPNTEAPYRQSAVQHSNPMFDLNTPQSNNKYYVNTASLTGNWKDQQGNIYSYFTVQGRNATADTLKSLIKTNASTGETDWSLDLRPYITAQGGSAIPENLAGNGERIYLSVTAAYTTAAKIYQINAKTGVVEKTMSVASDLSGNYRLIGYFDGIVVGFNGLWYEGFDENLNLKWKTDSVKVYYNKANYITKDGYLLFVARESSMYKDLLFRINLKNGSVKSFDIGLPEYSVCSCDSSRPGNYGVEVQFVDDNTIFLSYRTTHIYSDGEVGYTTQSAKVVTFSNATDSESSNESDTAGQLMSPSSLRTADGDFTFDLKYNDRPNPHRFAGFGFRIQDNKNLYRVEILDGKVKLVKYVNGVRTVLKSTTYPVSVDAYTTYRVKVTGDVIKVYASGTPILDATDTQFQDAGAFGNYSNAPRTEFKRVGYKLLGGGNSATYDNVTLVDTPATYDTTFTDPENDPMIASLSEWKYVQTNANKFLDAGDGKSGTSALHNQTVQSPFLSFDKVGLYQVTYKVPDDPNNSYPYPNATFGAYRQMSDPFTQSIVVHRKPIAVYTLAINASTKNVAWTDASYDPDRWLSATKYSGEATGIDYKATRGVLEKKFYYISPSGVTKSEKLVTPTEVGIYTVGMAVKDEYGAWSDWNEQTLQVDTIATPNTPPVPGFTLSAISTYRGVGVTINSTAYDAEDGPRENIAHEYYIRNTSAGGAETLQSASRTSWTKTFNTMGVFVIRQVIEDSQGAIAQLEKQITVSNRLPVVNVTIPSSADQNAPTKLTALRPSFAWTYADADNDPQSQVQLRIYRYGGVLLMDSGIMTGTAASWTPGADLPEKTNLYVQARAYDGYEWGNWSAAKFFYIETNRPPTADFTWTPSPVYEGDTVRFRSIVGDPDGDALTVDYVLTSPSGAKYPFSALIAPPYDSQSWPVLRMTEIGSWTATMSVSDGKAPAVTVSKTIRVEPLGVTGFVKHTADWEKNRLAYNAKFDPDRPPLTFWAGEAFVLEARTTDTGGSGTKASIVTVRMFGNHVKSLAARDASTKTEWSGLLRGADTGIDLSKLKDGPYTFIFTATYDNGTVKTDSVTITIADTVDAFVQVHRLQ